MNARRTNVLIRAFRALMPHDERFIERFSEHSRLIVPAAEAFRALMSGDGRAEEHAAEISRLEDAADQITRDTVLGDPPDLRHAVRPLADPRPDHGARRYDRSDEGHRAPDGPLRRRLHAGDAGHGGLRRARRHGDPRCHAAARRDRPERRRS